MLNFSFASLLVGALACSLVSCETPAPPARTTTTTTTHTTKTVASPASPSQGGGGSWDNNGGHRTGSNF